MTNETESNLSPAQPSARAAQAQPLEHALQSCPNFAEQRPVKPGPGRWTCGRSCGVGVCVCVGGGEARSLRRTAHFAMATNLASMANRMRNEKDESEQMTAKSSSSMLLYVHKGHKRCQLGTGSPERPPRLSHSS